MANPSTFCSFVQETAATAALTPFVESSRSVLIAPSVFLPSLLALT